jgi:hypothetical protein
MMPKVFAVFHIILSSVVFGMWQHDDVAGVYMLTLLTFILWLFEAYFGGKTL